MDKKQESIKEEIKITPNLKIFFENLKNYKRKLHNFVQECPECEFLYKDLNAFFRDPEKKTEEDEGSIEEGGLIEEIYQQCCVSVLDENLNDSEEQFFASVINSALRFFSNERKASKNSCN